jgi:hypothetical protein
VSAELQRALETVQAAEQAMARRVLDSKPELRRLELAVLEAG